MTEEATSIVKENMSTGRASGGLVPTNFQEMYKLAVTFVKGGFAPKGSSPEQVVCAMQMGLESGLGAMQGVQSIAVINGRPTIFGDAAIGLVRASGLVAEHSEKPITDKDGNVVGYEVYSKRTDGTDITHRFTIEDAKKAGLFGKSGPWKDYTRRMLQLRARSWVVRDLYADVLRGLHVREEVEDYVEAAGVRTVSDDGPTESLKARLTALETEALEQDSVVGEVPFGGDSEVIDAEVVEEPEPKKPSLKEDVIATAETLAKATDPYAVGNLLLKNGLPKVAEMNGGQLKKALNVLLDALAELEG